MTMDKEQKWIDHLWLWCHNAGVYNSIPNVPNPSDYTPVEAAAYMGIRNILMVVYGGNPVPPFAGLQEKFNHFDRVVWSVIGDSSSHRSGDKTDVDEIIGLSEKHPNIIGGIMDDFFNATRPAFALGDIAKKMRKAKLPLWVVLYDHDLTRTDLAEKLALCDVINFWTWDRANLVNLKKNMAEVQKIAPGKKIVLGCYLWNFGDQTELTIDQMKFQCDQGLKWLKDGTVQELVVLGSPLIGMDLPTIEWTRNLIKKIT